MIHRSHSRFVRAGSARARHGFTLVELLVVISIIGTLVAMLLPAVQAAREAARRNTCMNNQHQLSLAVSSFTGARKIYPGYRDSLQSNVRTSPTATTPMQFPVSWATMLLPYIEQPQLFNNWKIQAYDSSKNQFIQLSGQPNIVFLEGFTCPSDTTTQLDSVSTAPMSYLVNCGQADMDHNVTGVAPDWAANGVFVSRWEWNTSAGAIVPLSQLQRQTPDTIRDGTSNTFLLSEGLDAKQWHDEVSYPLASGNGYQSAPIAGANASYNTSLAYTVNTAFQMTKATPEIYTGFVWWDASSAPQSPVQSINGIMPPPGDDLGYATDMLLCRPTSAHPGVVNMTYCDGRTATLNENIEYGIYCLLMTPDGAHCNPVGKPFMSNSQMGTSYPTYYSTSNTAGCWRTGVVSGTDVN